MANIASKNMKMRDFTPTIRHYAYCKEAVVMLKYNGNINNGGFSRESCNFRNR